MSEKETVSITSSDAMDIIRGVGATTKEELTINVGKTLICAKFMPYEYVLLEFSDGTSMKVVETGYEGALTVEMDNNPKEETR